MEIGTIGLGRMGGNMVRRLLRAQQRCVVFNRAPGAVRALAAEGAVSASSPSDLVGRLSAPRAIWPMVPAAAVARASVGEHEAARSAMRFALVGHVERT